MFEAQNSIFRNLIRFHFPIQKDVQMIFLGNEYSGYWFPKLFLEAQGTLWGAGLGFDSSFEMELLNHGYIFYGFEPETKCFKTSINQFRNTSAIIENYGLWDKSGSYKFTGENISIVNIFKLEKESEQSLSIRSLWEVSSEQELEKLPRPRVLKLNIEGAEREILLRFIDEPIDFDVLIFQAEFLFHLGFKRVNEKIKAYKELKKILIGFQALNWKIVNLSRHQITLISAKQLNKIKLD